MTIALTEADILRLQVIATDSDAEDALRFIREHLLPQVAQQHGQKMRSHLDGGKGSMR